MDGDKSCSNPHHTPLIVKRAKYIARFNDINWIYHVMPMPQFIARCVGARFIAPDFTLMAYFMV